MLVVKQDPSKQEVKFIAGFMKANKTLNKLNLSPALAVLKSVDASRFTFVVTVEREPIALVGVCNYPYEEDAGLVWLMTTDKVAEHPVEFCKVIKNLVQTYGFMYSKLFSFVETTDLDHQKFNKFMGFSQTPTLITELKENTEYICYEQYTPKGLEALYNQPSYSNVR
jgi:hypothetical protein